MNRKLIFILIVTLFALSFSVFQYVKEFQSEIADAAYTSKPTMGHSWTEMECSEGLCVTTDNKVGIGTSTPGSKLDVAGTINSSSFSTSGNITSAGSITATGDVCGAGACLSQIASFVGSQPLVNNVHNYTACTNAGGTVTPSDVSFPMCKFSASSCPTSANSNGTGTWTQYKSYGTYGPTTCNPMNCQGYSYGGTPTGYSCTTTSSGFVNGPTLSTCTYYQREPRPCGDYTCCDTLYYRTCTSAMTEIGCY